MSPHDGTNDDGARSGSAFDELMLAHCNRELDGVGRARLDELAAADASRGDEVAAVDALLGKLDVERGLYEHAMAPLQAREEADPAYRRLSATAAVAQDELRTRLLELAPPPVRGRLFRLNRWLPALAAAAVLIAVLIVVWPKGTPADRTLAPKGLQNILLTPEISATAREISWHVVPGARDYEVVVTDADNRTVLERLAAQSRSNKWALTAAQVETLKAARDRGELFLRVVARDGGGIRVGTTGDVELHIR